MFVMPIAMNKNDEEEESRKKEMGGKIIMFIQYSSLIHYTQGSSFYRF